MSGGSSRLGSSPISGMKEAPPPSKQQHKLKERPSVALTERILQEISDSLVTFKPSKSLAMLSALAEDYEQEAVAEIDICITGGGMKGYFMTGCYAILAEELKKRNIKIARIAGTSAGAWAGLLMCTGLGTRRWIETYYGWKERGDATIHEAYDEMYHGWIREVLPEDAYKRCSGRLFISITVFNNYGMLENMIVSQFESNDDLYNACCASSTIPFISERVGDWGSGKWGLRRYRGRLCVDGGLTNNCPVFKDGVRRQLVFQLGNLDYSAYRSLSHSDDCIEVLVIRGAMLMAQFLEGNQTSTAIEWLDVNENANELAPSVNTSTFTLVKERLNANKYLFLGAIALYRWYFGDFGVSRTIQALGVQPHIDAMQPHFNRLNPSGSFQSGYSYLNAAFYRVGSLCYEILVNIYK